MRSQPNPIIDNMARVIMERARSSLATTRADLIRKGFALNDIQTFGERAVTKASSMAANEGIGETFLEVQANAYI